MLRRCRLLRFLILFLFCFIAIFWLNINSLLIDINNRLFSELLLKETNVSDPAELAVLIDRLNQKQQIVFSNGTRAIVNEEGSWPLTAGRIGSIAIVIQVHNRRVYLEKVIDSLSRARYIENTLLIFSHDFYSDQLNWLVRSITFAPVIQIFFPYSIQLYPTTLPGGQSIDDEKDKVIKGSLTQLSQTKHHWWWKANFIFNGHLRILQDYQGPVLFIEEDHWLAEDFLHVLWHQQRLLSQYNKARILSLGSYILTGHTKPISSQIDLVQWVGNRHNMAMAFNRTVWRQFQNCSEMFCSYNDYNVISC